MRHLQLRNLPIRLRNPQVHVASIKRAFCRTLRICCSLKKRVLVIEMSASELDEDLPFPFPKAEQRSPPLRKIVASPDYLTELRDLIEEASQKQEEEFLKLISGIYRDCIKSSISQISNSKTSMD